MSADDTWVLRAKLSLLILGLSLLLSSLDVGSGLGSLLGLVFVGAYLGGVGSVWFDARAVRKTGTWKPTPWLWAGVTFFFYGAAILYLLLRLKHVGDTGPAIRSVFTSRGDDESGPDRQNEGGDSEDRSRTLDEVDEVLERADAQLERGGELLEQGSYLDARDAFNDARDAYDEAQSMAESNPSLSTPRTVHRVDRAERGIEACWIGALEERLDEAEARLEAGEVERAQSEFEQVRAALDGQTFDHHDADDLERRVREGATACAERIS
jgi:hypothetical protein